MKFVVLGVSSHGHFKINGQPTGTVLNKGYFIPWHNSRFNLLDIQLELFLQPSKFALKGTAFKFTINQSM